MKLYSGHGKLLAKKYKRKRKLPLRPVLFLLFGVVFIVSAVAIAKHLIESEQEKSSFI